MSTTKTYGTRNVVQQTPIPCLNLLCPSCCKIVIKNEKKMRQKVHNFGLFPFSHLENPELINPTVYQESSILVYHYLQHAGQYSFYRKDTEHLYHALVYSIVILLSGIYPFKVQND